MARVEPKLPKKRKPQTDEEYQFQLNQFLEEGPTINTSNWLLETNISTMEVPLSKTDSTKLIHLCEKLYYNKSYEECWSKIKEIEIKLDTHQKSFDGSLAPSNAKKTEKIIAELSAIKTRCQEKLGAEPAT